MPPSPLESPVRMYSEVLPSVSLADFSLIVAELFPIRQLSAQHYIACPRKRCPICYDCLKLLWGALYWNCERVGVAWRTAFSVELLPRLGFEK